MENILIGVVQVFDPPTLLMLIAGVFLGLVIGAIPGLTTNMAIAIMVPITYTMAPAVAFVFLVAIYCAGAYGGSIAAILIGIPGTGAAVATTIDGHPMAKNGEAGKALFLATVFSVLGGLVSTIVLFVAAPQLARVAVKLGPGEYFALGIFGIVTVSSMSESKSVSRGMISGILGLLLSTVGLSPLMGTARFTFGNYHIIDGFPLVPVFIGLFGLGTILTAATKTRKVEGESIKLGKVLYPVKEILRYYRTFIRSTTIGVVLGAIPGPGAVAASFLSHDQAKRHSKHPETFGKGEPEGVVATESANNAVVGSSLVPLLALGVPGNSVSALFLGALLLHGLRPGPALFRDTPEIGFSIIVAMFVANLLMGPAGILIGRGFSYFLKVPVGVMHSLILAICSLGTFSLRKNIGDLYVMIAFGLGSYFMKKLDIPSSPIVLGLILGPMIEKNLHSAMTIYDHSFMFLLTRPVSLALMLLALWSLISGIRRTMKNKDA